MAASKSRTRNRSAARAAMLLLVVAAVDVPAAIINGDFATGDLSGWTVSAIDDLGAPIDPTPFIFATSIGTTTAVEFTTGAFADGLFIATLEQTFTVDAATPILRFDFSLPTVLADSTGTGTSPFLDSIIVSVDDGLDFYELLLMDSAGALADPFGTAPGAVTLGVSPDPIFDFRFGADLSALAGGDITLFIDVINEDDGFLLDPPFSFFTLDILPLERPVPVPAPGTLPLLSIGLTVLLTTLKCKRRRSRRWRFSKDDRSPNMP